MFRSRSRQQVVSESVRHLLSKSSITHTHPGSKARALIEAVALVIGNVGQDVSQGLQGIGSIQ